VPRRRLEAFNADDNLTTLAYVPGGYGHANACGMRCAIWPTGKRAGITAAEMIEPLRPDNEPNYEGHKGF
jgi:hypothetical protein